MAGPHISADNFQRLVCKVVCGTPCACSTLFAADNSHSTNKVPLTREQEDNDPVHHMQCDFMIFGNSRSQSRNVLYRCNFLIIKLLNVRPDPDSRDLIPPSLDSNTPLTETVDSSCEDLEPKYQNNPKITKQAPSCNSRGGKSVRQFLRERGVHAGTNF